MAPERSEADADQTEVKNYKGGMVVASPSRTEEGVGGEGYGLTSRYEPHSSKLHETSTKHRADRTQDEPDRHCGSSGPAFALAALEQMIRDRAGAQQKNDALPNLGGRTMGSLGHALFQKLLEVLPLRSQPMGEGKARTLFPLPTSKEFILELQPGLTEDELAWTLCVCWSLNSLWGEALTNDSPPNSCQKRCLDELVKLVQNFAGMTVKLDDLSWDQFLQVKSVDYRGDEVKVGRWFSWSNISPALPAEVGKVPLAEVCSLGAKHYVEAFDDFLKSPSEWRPVRSPRVMVSDSCWGEVCTGLVSSGVCVWLEESEVFQVDDSPLLNGLFGVSKDDFTDEGVEIFRLIMDLRPLNALCMPISGDVETLLFSFSLVSG